MTFVKNYVSNFTRSNSGESLMRRDVSCLLRHIEIFHILIVRCKFAFILIAAVIIELTFVPFQQRHHCLCTLEETIKVEGFVFQFCYPVATVAHPD